MDIEFTLKNSGGLFELLAKDYELLHKGSIRGVLSFYDWKYVEFMIDQNQYTIRSNGKAMWSLDSNSQYECESLLIGWLDNPLPFLYKTLGTYIRISGAYEFPLSIRIASFDLQRPCEVLSLNR